MLKQFSGKILAGNFKGIMNINKPACNSAEYSLLEIISFEYLNTHFLDLAAEAEDDLERMKYVIAFVISSKFYTQTRIFNRAPYDCIIGDTLQQNKLNATSYYSQCISTNPPIYLVYIKGQKYDFNHSNQLEISLLLPSFNSLTGINPALFSIKFSNGSVFNLKKTDRILIDGLIAGD